MALTILLPALACCAVLALGSARKALLNVYLPVVLLLPQYYVLRIQHLPPLSFADAAVIPLALVLLAAEMPSWRWSWMDLWVILLAASSGLSEGLSTELANGDWIRLFSATSAASPRLGVNIANGGLTFVNSLLTFVLPYMIGKILLEQRDSDGAPMSRKAVRRMVSLLAAVAVIGVYDFAKGVSLWQKAFRFLLPYRSEIWEPQVRWGFGRVAGPFGQAILAGLIFLVGLIYCLWLRRVDRGWGTRRIFAALPLTARGLILAALAGGLLMTQSRGPWIGLALALVFVLFTRMFSAPKAVLAFAFFLGVFAPASYLLGKQYTQASLRSAATEAQRNAVYRRELLTNYLPVVAERPTFGWGATSYPIVDGQRSIDNEYLLLAVTQGLFGLALFALVVAGTGARLLQLMSQSHLPEERQLAIAHLSVLIGVAVTITTVYLGEQVTVIFFLFIGWVQGMRPESVAAGAWQSLGSVPRFRRVLA